MDHLQKTITSWLQSKEIDQTADYLNRGRAYKAMNAEDLKVFWIESFRNFTEDYSDVSKRTQLEDVQAELALREIPLPFEDVAEHLEKLTEAAQVAAAELSSRPEDLERVSEEIAQELADFMIQRIKDSN